MSEGVGAFCRHGVPIANEVDVFGYMLINIPLYERKKRVNG